MNMEVHQHVTKEVGRALKLVPLADTDIENFNRIVQSPETPSNIFEHAKAIGVEFTPRMWARYLFVFTANWNKLTQDRAVLLPAQRDMYAVAEDKDAELNLLLDEAAQVLAAMGWDADLSSGRTDDEASRAESVMVALYGLAKAVEKFGNAAIAYNLAALSVGIGPKDEPLREHIVRYALSLAITADRMHQIAVCSVYLAEAVVLAADADAERKLEAFDCCEVALERLRQARDEPAARPVWDNLVREMIHLTDERDYLRVFLAPLLSMLPTDDRPEDWKSLLPENWIERVSARPIGKWYDQELFRAETMFDLKRLELEKNPQAQSATVDWTSLSLDHPSYRRAVPTSRSFLREKHFENRFLVLTHEMTHVLSLIGGIGNALSSLRDVAYGIELALWKRAVEADEETLRNRIIQEGVAPPKEGDVISLLRAEQGLEVAFKAVDSTPFFFGLASHCGAPTVKREAEEEEPQAARAKFRTPFCPNRDKMRSNYVASQ